MMLRCFRVLRTVSVVVCFCLGVALAGEESSTKVGSYLFAHMMKQDYGRLYYSVSEDGLHWTILNHGKRVNNDYRGHPDIMRGHDGHYYLLGNPPDRGDVRIWVSSDHMELSSRFRAGHVRIFGLRRSGPMARRAEAFLRRGHSNLSADVAFLERT